MMPDRDGLFNAHPLEIGVAETGENKLATCTIRFGLIQESVEGEWVSCAEDGMEILGFFYLEKKDGSLNTMAVESLKAALGWDGRDPFWLQDNAETLTAQVVQVKLAFEEFKGKNRIKVQYLNPYGSSRSADVRQADQQGRQAIGNRLGPRLRSLAGGTPADPPKPTIKPELSPVSAQAATEETVPGQRVVATEQVAWAKFCEATTHLEVEHRNKEWLRTLTKLFGDKSPDQFSPEDWGRMAEEAPGLVIPF